MESTTKALAELAANVDPHVEWAKQRAHLLEVLAIEDDALVQDVLLDRAYALDELIASTPAHTPLGIAEQVRLAVEARDAHGALSKADVTGLRNAVAALETMARGA